MATTTPPNGELIIRAGLATDLPTLDAIARAAKAHWGYSAAQLAAWHDDLTTRAESLRARPLFVAQRDGVPVGFVQVATDTAPWEIWALWIEPSRMRRGIGRALLERAMDLAAAAGQTELAIDADPHALAFYRACGARVVGEIAAPIDGEPDRARPQLRLPTRRSLGQPPLTRRV